MHLIDGRLNTHIVYGNRSGRSLSIFEIIYLNRNYSHPAAGTVCPTQGRRLVAAPSPRVSMATASLRDAREDALAATPR